MALGYQATIITAQGDGSQLSNSTTPTSILPGQAKATLPPNFFYIGKTLRLTATGRISNVITTPGTLTLDIRLGSVIVATTQAINLDIVAKTNVTWRMDWLLTCRAVGASTSANLMHVGSFASESVVGSPVNTAGGVGVEMVPATAPAVGTGFDSTAAQIVDMFATFSVSTNPTNLTLHQFLLEDLN